MKKHLLTASVLLLWAHANSQNIDAVKHATGFKNGQTRVTYKQDVTPQNTVNTTPIVVKPKNTNAKSAGITAVTAARFTGSHNAFGVLVSENRPLQYNPGSNIISFVHRKSVFFVPTANGNSGSQVASTSNNGGTSWDSTCIWANASDLARYPQGGVYNPLGNTTYTNAYVVGSGPITNGSIWVGNWYASKKITSPGNPTAGADQQSMINTSLPAGVKPHHHSQYAFTAIDGGMVRSMGNVLNDPDGTTNVAYGIRGAMMTKGLFTAGAFVWSTDSFVPCLMARTDGSKYVSDLPLQAWNENGTVGYVVMFGVRCGALPCQKSYQPIVYKTTNSGASWSILPAAGFNAKNITDRIQSINTNTSLVVPYFSTHEGWDVAVDANNNLHIGCTVQGASSANIDSLDYTYSYGTQQYSYSYVKFGFPTIFDFNTTASGGWNSMIVDSMGTEGPFGTAGYPGYATNPWTDGGTAKLDLNARIQMSRSADGKKIFFGWTESDSTVTGLKWNIYPDIKHKGFDVTTNKLTPRLNVTKGSLIAKIEQLAYFHFMSNKAIATGTTSYEIPYTVSNNPTNNGGIAIDHYYVKGATIAATAFSVNPIIMNAAGGCGVLGINTNSAPENNFNFYPNPTSENVNIVFGLQETQMVNITVFNYAGQLIDTKEVNGVKGENTVAVDLSKYSSGLYLFTVKTKTSSITKKLIKE